MVLERLNKVEISSLTFREAILAVKLELGGDNRVLSPTVHGQGRLSKNESAGIRDTR